VCRRRCARLRAMSAQHALEDLTGAALIGLVFSAMWVQARHGWVWRALTAPQPVRRDVLAGVLVLCRLWARRSRVLEESGASLGACVRCRRKLTAMRVRSLLSCALSGARPSESTHLDPSRILDTVHLGLVMHTVYWYTVSQYGDFHSLDSLVW
jgi:hypothetical protein